MDWKMEWTYNYAMLLYAGSFMYVPICSHPNMKLLCSKLCQHIVPRPKWTMEWTMEWNSESLFDCCAKISFVNESVAMISGHPC